MTNIQIQYVKGLSMEKCYLQNTSKRPSLYYGKKIKETYMLAL